MPQSILQSASKLRTPTNYFRGFTPEELCVPENVLLFSRTTRNDLQQKSFESFPHQRFVFAFNLETEGTITADGIPWRLRQNEAFLIFPYQFHQFIELGQEKITWLFITFELENNGVMETFRHRVLKLDNKLLSDLAAIVDLFQGQKSERIKRRLTLEIACLINDLREQLTVAPKTAALQRTNGNQNERALIRDVQQCLNEHSGELHSVSKIAEQLHMSESNLRAKFRSQFKLSLGAYIRNYRAHQAILLLKNPAMSLTEIAFELGFTTLPAFSRFFHKATGSSPRDYRGKLLK